MDKNQIEELKKLYNDGCSQYLIAETMGIGRKSVFRALKKLFASGELQDRGRATRTVVKQYKARKKSEEKIPLIIAMYNDNKSFTEIGDALGIAESNISRWVKILIENGTIEKRENIRKRKEPKPEKFKKEKKIVESTLAKGETVECTEAVSQTCIYGCENSSAGLCRYSLCMHHLRGCSHKACDKYSKISRDNPRLKCEGE